MLYKRSGRQARIEEKKTHLQAPPKIEPKNVAHLKNQQKEGNNAEGNTSELKSQLKHFASFLKTA